MLFKRRIVGCHLSKALAIATEEGLSLIIPSWPEEFGEVLYYYDKGACNVIKMLWPIHFITTAGSLPLYQPRRVNFGERAFID